MKAILEYHGFTRMVDVHETRDIYEVMIPPEVNGYSLTMDSLSVLTAKVKYLIFYKTQMEMIDGELVALFEFKEER